MSDVTDLPLQNTRDEPDDQDLKDVTDAVAGDQEAFARLVYRYTDVIYRLSYRMLGDSEDACDATQDVLLKLHRYLPRFSPPKRFYSWLYTIALNHLRSLLRKRFRRTEITLDPEETLSGQNVFIAGDNPEQRVMNRVGEKLAEEALVSLDAAHKEVFILRIVEELSVRDTAEILGISENTVKTRLHRAKKRLGSILAQQDWVK